MATQTNIELKRGRTQTITATITGIDDWTDLLATLYASEQKASPSEVIALDGVIDEGNDKIVFDVLYATTNELVIDKYNYEIVIYKEDKTFVKTPIYGELTVSGVVRLDPTA